MAVVSLIRHSRYIHKLSCLIALSFFIGPVFSAKAFTPILVEDTAANTPIHPYHNSSSKSILSTADNTGLEVPILAYHNISLDPGLDGDEYTVTYTAFEKQLDILQSYGYTTVTLQDYLDYCDPAGSVAPPDKPVVLTFDDGYETMFTLVLPSLVSRGMQASFFIPTGKIGNNDSQRQQNSWSSSYTQGYIYSLMIWPEVQALEDAGMEIGSHSVNHSNLTRPGISIDEIRSEIFDSKQVLDNKLQAPIHLFSYPYGNGGDSPQIKALLAEAGYDLALDFGNPDELAVIGVSDIFNLPRRNIPGEVSLVLNPQDPWHFFIRRVDPDFAIPSISVESSQVVDLDGNLRSRLVAGEVIEVSIKASNCCDYQAADVSASLVVKMGGEPIYDSHLQVPAEDIELAPFPIGDPGSNFTYGLSIPEAANPGMAAYQFCVYDLVTHLMTYFCSEEAPLIEVVASPISVRVETDPETLAGAGNQQVDFLVTNTGPPGTSSYLTISLAPELRVVETLPVAVWKFKPVGSTIKSKTSGTMDSLYELYEVGPFILSTGTFTYSLVLTSRIGAPEEAWIRYRLVSSLPADATIPDISPMRWPLFGDTDQQGWYARILPVMIQREDIFLPIISQ